MATKADVILSAMGIKLDEEMTPEKINEVFRNFKEAKKILDDYEKKTLRPFLFQSAEQLGEQTESGGYKVLLEDGTGWEKQARVSVKVDNEKAIGLLNEKHLAEYIDKRDYVTEDNMDKAVEVLKSIGRYDLIATEETVSNNSLEQLYLEGKISDDELSSIIERKVTYALVEVKPRKKK